MMKKQFTLVNPPFSKLLCGLLLSTACCYAGQYANFSVAIYIPVSVVQGLGDSQTLSNAWQLISSQLKVDKVYIEVQRDRKLAGDVLLESVKKFFRDRGVRVAGGMALSDGESGQFRSFCHTEPIDREFIKNADQLAARHFDEIILDDFFFVTTKYESDITAKGSKTWTQFRLDLMDDAAQNLLIGPAKAVNHEVKMVIKFPNWYEHFQGLGYDLDKEPKLFDGIYTGTETRDPETTDQNLQQYDNNTFSIESYLPKETDVRVSVTGDSATLRNIVTGELMACQTQPEGFGRRRRGSAELRASVNLHLLPHSYQVFSMQK